MLCKQNLTNFFDSYCKLKFYFSNFYLYLYYTNISQVCVLHYKNNNRNMFQLNENVFNIKKAFKYALVLILNS